MKLSKRKLTTIAVICLVFLITFLSWLSDDEPDRESIQQGSISGYSDAYETDEETQSEETENTEESTSDFNIPEYSGDAYTVINGNDPAFTEKEKEVLSCPGYEYYSALDSLGRCGYAQACVGTETMPEAEEERESISSVQPSGWQQAYYSFVDGKYLYNRSHLIGWQLTAENANDHNLITGTRTFNVEGMLPFENKVAEYVEDTGNHVMYKVTPVFEGNNLLATGVLMQAKSVEDNGLSFNVFAYNAEPGVEIDYATGKSEEK